MACGDCAEQSLIFGVGGEKNMDWCLYGEDKRREIDRDLKPECLKYRN